jgi:hypothetical protein
MQELILSAVYRDPHYLLDFTLDKTSLAIGSRSAAVHTLSQGSFNRLAASAGAVWLINSWLESGLAYGYAKNDDYTQMLDGTLSTVKGFQTSLLQWKIEIRPVANVKVGVEMWLDTSSADARKRADGTTFDPQNKVLLQWAMAL